MYISLAFVPHINWNPKIRGERRWGFKSMAQYFPNMAKDLNLQIQETPQIPKKIPPTKKSTPRYIIVKLLKTKDKEKILKAAREKWYLPYNEKTFWMTSNFSLEALESRKSGTIFPFLFFLAQHFQVLKEKCQLKILYPVRIGNKKDMDILRWR